MQLTSSLFVQRCVLPAAVGPLLQAVQLQCCAETAAPAWGHCSTAAQHNTGQGSAEHTQHTEYTEHTDHTEYTYHTQHTQHTQHTIHTEQTQKFYFNIQTRFTSFKSPLHTWDEQQLEPVICAVLRSSWVYCAVHGVRTDRATCCNSLAWRNIAM